MTLELMCIEFTFRVTEGKSSEADRSGWRAKAGAPGHGHQGEAEMIGVLTAQSFMTRHRRSRRRQDLPGGIRVGTGLWALLTGGACPDLSAVGPGPWASADGSSRGRSLQTRPRALAFTPRVSLGFSLRGCWCCWRCVGCSVFGNRARVSWDRGPRRGREGWNRHVCAQRLLPGDGQALTCGALGVLSADDLGAGRGLCGR